MTAFVLGWAVTAAVFSSVTLWRLVRRRASTPSPVPADGGVPDLAGVLLLRPLDEPTAGELDNLALPLPAGAGVRHVVLSPYRPRLPDGVEWHYSDPVALNRKVGHVLYAVETLRRAGELVLVVDADVAVDAELVAGLVAPLRAGAALSTAAPVPVGGSGPGALAVRGLLRATQHSFVALDAMSAGAKAICGKALGLSDAALEVLRALDRHIGEDLELSRLLHARGLAVALSAVPARVPLRRVPLAGALRRFRRWMQVLRAHRPALYPTIPWLFAPTPLLAVAALLLGSPAVVVALAVLVAVRIALGLALTRGQPDAADGGWEWLLGEALLLAGWTASLVVRTVAWRGRRFVLQPGGVMERAPAGGES